MPRTVHVAEATITRPANTTQYAAGDGIAAGTAAVLEFSDIVPYNGWSGLVTSARLVDSSTESTALDAELWLFTVAPTVPADNAAFSPTDAEMAYFVGFVRFNGDDRETTANNSAYTTSGVNVGFKCAAAARSLYGILVSRNTYTPTSGEVFRVEVHVLADQ